MPEFILASLFLAVLLLHRSLEFRCLVTKALDLFVLLAHLQWGVACVCALPVFKLTSVVTNTSLATHLEVVIVKLERAVVVLVVLE